MSSPPLNDGIASGRTFQERAEPDAFTTALGYVVLAFSELERSATRPLSLLLGIDSAAAEVIACELPFQKKIHLLAALVRLNPRNVTFQSGAKDPNEVFSTHFAECCRAEELRNTIMHSSWETVPHEPERMLRFKWTAKAKKGLHTRVDEPDTAVLLDVGEFIEKAAWGLDLFFAPPIVTIPDAG